MLTTARSKLGWAKPEGTRATTPAPLTMRFITLYNFPALGYLPIRTLVALIILGICFVRAYVGLWGSRIYTQDAFQMLDGAWRVLNGQRPHVDFYTGLGPVVYLITAAGTEIASGNAVGIAYGQSLFGCVAGLWAYLLCERRLRDVAIILVCISLVLMATVPTTIGGSSTGTTPGGTYNRYSYALVVLLMIETVAVCRPNRRLDELWGGVSTGLALGVLLFLKISFFLGAGFLLLALAPLREQTRNRWYGIGVALVFVVLVFAWYLRFDLVSVFSDLRTVARTKRFNVGWYLLKDVIIDAAPFLLFVHLISRSIRSQWERNSIRIAGLGLCLAGFFTLLTSWQFYGLPLNAIMAILLLDRLVPESASAVWASRLRFSVLLFGSLFGLMYIGSEIMGLNYALSQKRSQIPHTSFWSPTLAGFNSAINSEYVEHTTTESEYVAHVNEGCDLVSQHRQPRDSVFSLSFTNPFSFALGMKPPRGGTTWLQYGSDFDEDGPPAERMFGDATLVMLPKVFPDLTLPGTIPRLFGPYLNSHYVLAAESPNWWMYRRKDGMATLPLTR